MSNKMTVEIESSNNETLLNMLFLAELLPKLSLEQQRQIISMTEALLSRR